MRTSPPPMRPARRRRAAASLVMATFAVVALLAAGCSDDDPEADDQPTPTTTAPSRDTGSTTTEATGTSTTETTDDGSAPDVPLTAETATEELQTLVEAYRDGLAEIRSAGALDEASLRTLTDAFTVEAAQGSIDGLVSRGGVAILAEGAGVPTVSDVEVLAASDTCAEITASIEGVTDLVTIPVEVVQPYTVRLVRAPEGASGSAWRLDFFSFHPDGQTIPEGACP